MNAKVNVEYMKRADRDLYGLSKMAAGYGEELEDVMRALRQQTEFEECRKSLRKAKEDIGRERYSLSILAQTLYNISGLYVKTEERIEQSGEAAKVGDRSFPTGQIDLSGLNRQINAILYGGGTDG